MLCNLTILYNSTFVCNFTKIDHSIIEFFETQFDYLTKNNIDIHPESKKYYEYLT